MEDRTERIISLFRELSAIPRKSKDETKVVAWLKRKADEAGFPVTVDEKLNVVIRVPGNKCSPSAPVVVLQGHTDMVCEKIPESDHDFTKDPITVIEKDGWLSANGTTLGADNGIAVAMALDAALDDQLSHPPLELLFTADEEQGMTGAKALREDFFSGRILINLDSEDEGVFTVGCAGGLGSVLEQSLEMHSSDGTAFAVEVSGLTGGHSGVDIHKPLANANILLARTLTRIADDTDIRMAQMHGGSARNAIPRNARAVIVGNGVALPTALVEDLKKEYPNETGLKVSIVAADAPTQALDAKGTRRLLWFLNALPNGVQRMSSDIDGLVETSCNLATVSLKDGSLAVVISSRSSMPSALLHLKSRIQAMASLAGVSMKVENTYPAWQPNMSSSLLERCSSTYGRLFGQPPTVEVIHAGLECGVIGENISGMDMISFGPTITGAHSPDERMHTPALRKVSSLLNEILSSFCEPQ